MDQQPGPLQAGICPGAVEEEWSEVDPREGEGNGGPTSSSPETSSLNGDGRRGKKPRRRKRASRGEARPVVAEGQLGGGDSRQVSPEESQSSVLGAALLGLQAESIWFNRSTYERAESWYQQWLANSGNGSSASVEPAPKLARREERPPARVLAPEPPADCRHADQVACHHLVRAVWVNKPAFDSAENNFMERWQLVTPGSLALQPVAAAAATPAQETPDEGYLSLAPTPATPATASPLPGPRQSINGLPRFPAELLNSVWLEKPRYDLAESAYYQSLYGPPPASPQGSRAKPRVHEASRNRKDFERGRPSQQNNTMSGVQYLAQEKIWFDKSHYDDAERRFYEGVNGPTHSAQETGANTILQDIARARENIQKSLAGLKTTLHPGKGSSRPAKSRQAQPTVASGAGDQGELTARLQSLELENQSLHKVVEDLRSALSKLETRVAVLEKTPVAATVPAVKAAPVQQPKVRAPVEEDDDDDLDLFGSDEEEDEEAERIREQRVKEYSERKAKKPALIAKSSILLDVKPWDDETDMAKLEQCVRSVQADGLLWGTSKLVPVGYGIKKLQIQCVVEDDKVGTDMLEEEITKYEDYVQSVDVAAFNKI